ncbi:tetratricopeptide repeat protein [Catalinimonas niigatensis]|uniref:tetratricopeptide repeat protein n=1 Tax=Catalinimonas niigatensis TaxID=1397264 RepID=UPI00266644C4|nr:tetratricopeptide repeat protein [Catalinimonas niigatensis]WPP51188.1 tetratricopeptide repeat protein [Catalinimonas niigatensis]
MISNEDRMIQRYLDEEMNEAEKREFEIQLLQTEKLRERLEEYRLITEGINYYGEQEGWKKIQALEKEAEFYELKSANKPIVTKWLYSGIAASLLLFMIGFSIYWQQDQLKYARLFDQHFEVYQALGGATRGTSAHTFVLPEAFEAYYNKEYSQAIKLFIQASEQEDRPYIWLYLGNAYLGNNQPQEAIKALENVLAYAHVDERTRLRTHWDLGLAHLKLNRKQDAIGYFEMIQDTEDYGQEAKTILNSIY